MISVFATALAIAFASVCWGLAAMSLLAVFRAPVYPFWKPAIAATEWGHWLAGIAIGVGTFGYGVVGLRWSVVPVAFAAVLFVSPSIRASRLAGRLPERVHRVFPPAGAGGARNRYGRRRGDVPLSVSRLAHIRIPAVDETTLGYSESTGRPLALDLYRPYGSSLPVRSRVVVVVHGGSWRSGDKSQLAGMNRYLASRGHIVVAPNYRLAPEHRFPAPVDDIHRAIEFLQSEGPRLGFETRAVVLLGRSSGGHLALSAAYDRRSANVCGVVALYAPTDLVWSWTRPAPRRLMDSNRVIRDFLGGTPEEMPERFERASPVRRVTSRSPPTLLIHGGKDELVSPLQSRRLASALCGAGVRHLHVELPWACHGMDANLAGPSGQISVYLIERFLESVFRT